MNEREEMKVTCIEPDQQALVTLANIEYRISVHMQGPYREILAVGCIRVKHRLHKGQRAQSRERWRFAKQIQPDLDCGKKAVQWEGAVRQALPNGLGYFYRGTPVPAGFTT